MSAFYAIFSLLMGISLRLHNIDTVEIREKDHLLRKSYLDKSNLSPDLNMESLGQLSFVKIKGLANFGKERTKRNLTLTPL